MNLKRLTFVFLLVLLINSQLYAQKKSEPEADQEISEFSLAGYGQEGKKTWDISGKTADIFTDIIKLKSVLGNLYGEKEDIALTADRGDFDKTEGKVHLEQNVVITTSSGARLTTDSLDWDRKKKIVSTQDRVNIEKENMVTMAQGATGEPDLNKIVLERDVQVKINPEQDKGPGTKEKDQTIITCDGPLQIDYEKRIAAFNKNVKVDRSDLDIYSDKMDIYFSAQDKSAQESKETPALMGAKIEKIVATGNVKIMQGENISYSDEAVYDAMAKKIILSGKPKLVIYSTEELKDASSGN
jgi:LPS export ABC transporter protein LptC